MLLYLALACRPDEAPPDTSAEDESDALIEGGVVTCAAPEERSSLGAMSEGWEVPPPAGWEPDWSYGTAIAVGDLDGDGLLDLLLPGAFALQVMIQQPDGSFIEKADSFELELPHLGFLASLIDLDADRDLDAIVLIDGMGVSTFLNDGAARFTLQPSTGLEGSTFRTRGLFWGDMDGDGDLDLALANDRDQSTPPEPGQDNELYERTGPLTWASASDRLLPQWRDGYTKLMPWLDADADGVMDLYVINHMPHYSGNYLLRNDGAGQFTAWPGPGLDVAISGMGFDQADINGDGTPDLLMSNVQHVTVMASDGGGGWYQADAALGIEVREEDTRSASWSAAWADMDNDGRVDIVSGFSPSDGDEHGELAFTEERDGIWIQQPDGSFLDQSSEWGLESLDANRAGVVVDLDRDGWLDVVKSARKGPAVLHRARCGEAGWLGVSLSGPTDNPHGIGARVQVEVDGQTQTRWIMSMGPGYMSSQPPAAHFGLGDADQVDALTVTWPDGTERRYEDVTPRQYVEAVW